MDIFNSVEKKNLVGNNINTVFQTLKFLNFVIKYYLNVLYQ